MKRLLFIFAISGIVSCSVKRETYEVVEVSCGQCNFEMDTPKGCDLAVRIDEMAYYVDGYHIDDFGDAHDIDKGFCEVIRKAEAQGEIINNRFEMTYLEFMEQDSVEAR